MFTSAQNRSEYDLVTLSRLLKIPHHCLTLLLFCDWAHPRIFASSRSTSVVISCNNVQLNYTWKLASSYPHATKIVHLKFYFCQMYVVIHHSYSDWKLCQIIYMCAGCSQTTFSRCNFSIYPGVNIGLTVTIAEHNKTKIACKNIQCLVITILI